VAVGLAVALALAASSMPVVAVAATGPAALRAFVGALDTLGARPALHDSLAAVLASIRARTTAGADADGWRALARSRLAFMARDDAREDAELAAARERARAAGDAELECRVLRELAWKASGSGRRAEATALARELRSAARREGTGRWIAESDLLDAALAFYSGGSMVRAESLSRAALDGFRRGGADWKTPEALGSIALYAQMQGREPIARAYYDSAITAAGRLGQRQRMARYIGNLAGLDRMTGRRERAARGYQRLYELAREEGPSPALIFGMHGMGTAALDRGLNRTAVAWGESLLALGAQVHNPDARARGYILLGLGHARDGRDAEAARDYRAILAMGDSIQPGQRVDAVLNLAASLERSDSSAAALAVLAANEKAVRSRSDEHSARLDLAYDSNLYRLGRYRDALAAAERAWATASHPTAARWRVSAATAAARSALAAGREKDAASWIALGREAFDADRSHVADPRVRETLGEQAAQLGDVAVLAALHHVAPRRAAVAAFEAYEPFRARTLVETLSGAPVEVKDPRPLARPAVTMAELRSRVLHEGELLLTAIVGPDTAVWVAVTRDTALLVPMKVNRARLAFRAAEFRRLIESPPKPDEPDLARAGRDARRLLARDLLGGVAGVVRASRTVIVAADGPLQLLPFTPLLADAAFEGAIRRVPEVAVVPSATALAVLRSREIGAARGHGLLAVAGPAGEDTTAVLPGGLLEVRWLSGRFNDVTAEVSPKPDTLEATLGRYAALHFAAHARADDESPWRSGILLEPEQDGQAARWLRAEDVLARRLHARLAVLAGCETAAGRVFTGEGVVGLSTAFLGAGVPAVVATLWRVDDRTTTRFVRRFYEGLARGDDSGEALKQARLALAADRGTSDPWYWAGFVLVGEPGQRLALAGRTSTRPLAISFGLFVLVLGGLMAFARKPERPPAKKSL